MNKGIWLVLALGTAGAVGCSASKNGTVEVTWAVTANGAAVDCADVGADGVEIVLLRASSGRDYGGIVDCDNERAAFKVPEGDYTLAAYPVDANDNRLFSMSDVANVAVASGQTTRVGVIEFAFEFGSVRFRVHMGSAAVTGGNCNPTNPNNGAGVALEEIRVSRGSQCVPFFITGVTDQNNQQVVEETCDQFICQLQTTVHIVTGLQDGQYLVQAFGYKGATSSQNAPLCYISNAMSFTINGANDVDLGTIFAPFDDSMDTQHLCNATKPSE